MELVHDANNNTAGEKCYSLRPRTALKRDEEDTDQEETWKPRGRTKRRSKQKPAPLSKYRRKTANARERSRMREINEAFEALRRAIPHLNSTSDSHNEKLTKITTLRLAMKYITALSNALQEPDLESDGESLLSDYTLTPPDFRDNSLTPTSMSEHSDLYDQFLTTSSLSESSSYNMSRYVSTSLTPPPSEILKLPPLTKLCPKPPPSYPKSQQEISFSIAQESRIPTFTTLTQASLTAAAKTSTFVQRSPRLPSLPEFSRYTLTPPEVSDTSLLDADFRDHCLTPSDFQDHTLVSTDFDGLPSPSVDFDDLFIS